MALAPPPSDALEEVRRSSFGFEEYLQKRGSSENCLRTRRIAQPETLQVGDTLGNGDRVLAPPRYAPNGGIYVLFSGGHEGHWIRVAARLPLALLTDEDQAPEELVEPMQE